MSEELTRRLLASVSLTLLFGTIVFATLSQNLSVMAAGSTIYVDDDNDIAPWDGTLEHPFQNITSGVANATHGDTLHVLNGTYIENVIVDKSITLKGDARPVIDSLNNIGIEITADNVTVEGFEITGASYGVYTDASGFNITDNVFTYDDYGIYWLIDEYNLTVDYIVHDSWITNNTFEMIINSAIYTSLTFDYAHQSGYDVEVGNIHFCDNTILLEETYAGGIDVSNLEVSYLDGGTVSVGVINMSGNRIHGGYTGIDFYGTLDELLDVHANFGDVIITNNVMINQSSEGMDIDFYDCTYLHGNTTSAYGSLRIIGNTITSVHGADGIYLSDIGYWYDFNDTASLEVDNIYIEENEIDVGGDGIYFYGYEAGYDLYDNSSLSIGHISVKNNTIISGGYGIEIDLEEFGYYMYGNSSFTMGDIEFSHNTIQSDYDGIYVGYLYYFGYEMYDYASFTMGSFRLSDNHITSSQAGIYTDYCEYLGEYMYGNSTYMMGDLEVSGNTINSIYNGIYIYEFYEFGYYLYGNSSFAMGSILVNNNVINSGSGYEGIYVDYIEYFGEYMYDTSTFTMEDIEFSGNNITSGSDGIYFYYLAYEFGYYMYGNSSFTMRDVLVNDNIINSDSDGIYIYELGYYGNYMYGSSNFTMGNFKLSGNIITSTSYGVYVNDFYEFGYYMNDNSSFTFGSIYVNSNTIHSGLTGIYLYNFEYFGEVLHNSSSWSMGDIECNDNHINSTEHGVYIGYIFYFGYYMTGNSTLVMGNIGASGNIINSTNNGIHFQNIGSIADRLYNDALFTMGNISVNDNVVDCGGDAIHISNIEPFGITVYDNASFTMDTIEFDGNTIGSGDAGMRLTNLENATIRDNVIQNCHHGIYLIDAVNNHIYHNVFNNTVNAYSNWINIWDNGYPSGGNYWSDYNGTDNYMGPGQNLTGTDGIGDTPYTIQIGNQDQYPFIDKLAWDETPPAITTLIQNPEIPDHLETVTIRVDVTDDESGVQNVTLSFSIDDGDSWINLTMEYTSGNTYQAVIPGQPADTMVQYRIIAYDKNDNLAVENNAGAYYVYTVIPEFIVPGTMLLGLIFLAAILILYRKLQLRTLRN